MAQRTTTTDGLMMDEIDKLEMEKVQVECEIESLETSISLIQEDVALEVENIK